MIGKVESKVSIIHEQLDKIAEAVGKKGERGVNIRSVTSCVHRGRVTSEDLEDVNWCSECHQLSIHSLHEFFIDLKDRYCDSHSLKMRLSLDIAERISNAVIATARRNKYSPITVVVTDAHASPIVTKRMDLCSPVGVPQFALAKAVTCCAMKISSREFRDKYTKTSQDPAKFCQMTAMVSITQSIGSMAPFPGGVVLKLVSTGEVIGAIGVSGAAGDEDEICALAGAKEAIEDLPGLASEPACS